MELKGGVIIIGSLLWDESPVRTKWRKACLKELSEKIEVSVNIRYGRKSSTRNDTYTMIFSNHPSTGVGRAYIVPFKEAIQSVKTLEKQAFALAKAEGIWKTGDPILNKGWGTVGLLINPNVDESKKKLLDKCVQEWSKLYSSYDKSYEPSKYAISDEQPVINKAGLLQLTWSEQMKEFDLLLATPVLPDPKRPLTSKEIADKMIKGKYREYFEKNHANGIVTFQDDEISEFLL